MRAAPRADREMVDGYRFEPIRGQLMLRWAGKRPFTSTQYFPAQEKERHGDEMDGWMNELYWGDNLQVILHLLKKQDLISLLALRARIWHNKPHESFRRTGWFLRVVSSRVAWLANGAEEIGFRLVCTAGLK